MLLDPFGRRPDVRVIDRRHAGPALALPQVDADFDVVDERHFAPAEQFLLEQLAVLQVREQFADLRLNLGEVVLPCLGFDVLGDQVLGDVPRQPLERRLLRE